MVAMSTEKVTAKSGVRRRISQRSAVLWLSAGCLLLTVFVLLVSGVLTGSGVSDATSKNLFAGRNFTFEPFTLDDAYDLCEQQAQIKRGASLLRYTTNPLSTRFEAKKNRFIVVLDADIGTVSDWHEVSLFCDIDPDTHKVSHYKEMYEHGSSLISRVKGLFGNPF